LKSIIFRPLAVILVIIAFAVPGANLLVSTMAAQAESPNELMLTVGKSVLVNSDQPIERVSVGFGDIAEASAVSPREVLVNAKAPGSTSLIVWQQGGGKLFFDVNVRASQFLANDRLDSVRREMSRELQGQDIRLSVECDAVFLRGNAKDLTSANRAVSIASTLGKVVNLMYVDIPAPEAQILLKVRFASLDKTAVRQLGMNLFSTGATNTLGSMTTQQFSAPALAQQGASSATGAFAFSDLLNIFLYRPDLNLGATIKALESKGLLEVLAEPNVLAENGKQGSFLAGGEFPYPVAQGGIGSTTVTIQFREFGIRLNFIPTVTPRGTIHLQVGPEVSSLDFSNGLVVNGFNVPALTTRRVNTEVELEEGQSFAIGGLLDKRVTDTFEKIPFIGNVPVLGKFFQTKNTNRQNTELIVIVTPELVRPIPAGTALPQLPYPQKFMESSPESALRTPGMASTGPVPVQPPAKSMPVEKLIQSMQPGNPLDVGATGKTASTLPAAPAQNLTNTPATAAPPPSSAPRQ
jgi:pilus assembly protein CpaC